MGIRYQGRKNGWRSQKEIGKEGDGEEEEGGEGLHWGGAPVSRSWFGVQDIGEGAAIPEGEIPGLTAEIVILFSLDKIRAVYR